MKKFSIVLMAIGCLAFATNLLTVSGMQRNRHNVSIRSNGDDNVFECNGRQQIFADDLDGYAKTEVNSTLPNNPLKVKAAHNGGVHVMGYSGTQIQVKVCIAAAARTDAEAKTLAASIKVNAGNGEVLVDGPEQKGRNMDEDSDGPVRMWTATILIQAPKNADLTLSSYNGGVSFYQFNGTAFAKTQNGGISLSQSSGKITAEAQNGGISIKDCSGDVQANVQNGGINVNVPRRWEGAGLEAHTHNGGMNIIVPKDVESGVEVKSGQWSHIRCDSACDGQHKDWDDYSKIVRFGNGTTVVRLSTVNGGVNISDHSWKDME